MAPKITNSGADKRSGGGQQTLSTTQSLDRHLKRMKSMHPVTGDTEDDREAHVEDPAAGHVEQGFPTTSSSKTHARPLKRNKSIVPVDDNSDDQKEEVDVVATLEKEIASLKDSNNHKDTEISSLMEETKALKLGLKANRERVASLEERNAELVMKLMFTKHNSFKIAVLKNHNADLERENDMLAAKQFQSLNQWKQMRQRMKVHDSDETPGLDTGELPGHAGKMRRIDSETQPRRQVATAAIPTAPATRTARPSDRPSDRRYPQEPPGPPPNNPRKTQPKPALSTPLPIRQRTNREKYWWVVTNGEDIHISAPRDKVAWKGKEYVPQQAHKLGSGKVYPGKYGSNANWDLYLCRVHFLTKGPCEHAEDCEWRHDELTLEEREYIGLKLKSDKFLKMADECTKGKVY